MSIGLSVLILAKNEEKNIVDCIKSVSFADEIILIDSGSSDKTCQYAAELGAIVKIKTMSEAGFAGQRNFALTVAKYDWVLYLDADERITPQLALEIKQHITNNEPIAAAIKRQNVVMGQLMKHGVYRPDYVTRLFPRQAVKWEGVVHERVVTDLPIKRLSAPAKHYCLINWEQYFAKFTKYTTLMAKKMQHNNKKVGWIAIQLHALFAFIKVYFLQLGFLDGKLGFILCQYHYFYTLTKYIKLQQLPGNTEKDISKI